MTPEHGITQLAILFSVLAKHVEILAAEDLEMQTELAIAVSMADQIAEDFGGQPYRDLRAQYRI